MDEQLDLVMLINDAGPPVCSYPRQQVHGSDTALHLAFSPCPFNPAGQLLLTQRALSKQTWAGVWTNSCCGHPRPGEQAVEALRRRAANELQVQATDLQCLPPDFRYRAREANAVVEYELCPAWAEVVDLAGIHPDSDEVAETSWVQSDDFVSAIHHFPAVPSPWAVAQLGGTHPIRHQSAPPSKSQTSQSRN